MRTVVSRLVLILGLAYLMLGTAAGCGDDNNAGTAAPARQLPPYDATDPDLPARLQEAFELWVEDFDLYGAAASVYTPGWLDWSSSTGVQDLETGEPYRADTLGRIASATKPFTGAIILQLIEEGRLSLDTRLSEFFPDYPNGQNITVEHLLTHRSGIPEIQLQDLVFIAAVLLNPEKWRTPQEILEWTYDKPVPIIPLSGGDPIPREPVGEPGERYSYSQPGFVALGYMIEATTGMDLADAYEERICEPLGMENTRLPRRDDPPDPTGYTNLFGLLDEKISGEGLLRSANGLISASWSAGGILSTARDLVTFLSGLLNEELFSADSLEAMTDWTQNHPDDPDDFYGLALSRTEWGDFTTIGHDGALPGGGSVMKYMPDLDVYVGAVTNTDRTYKPGAPDLVERVRWAVLGEEQDPEE